MVLLGWRLQACGEDETSPSAPRQPAGAIGPPSEIAGGDDLRRYVETRTLWAAPPAFGRHLGEAVADLDTTSGSEPPTAIENGVVVAHSVADIIKTGATLDEQGPVLLVAKVGSTRAAAVVLHDEVYEDAELADAVLFGPKRERIYALGTHLDTYEREVVFVPVRVIAVGEARGGKPTTYVTQAGEAKIIDDYGVTSSSSVPDLAREFGLRAGASPGGGGGGSPGGLLVIP